jgi:hypothetical protein
MFMKLALLSLASKGIVHPTLKFSFLIMHTIWYASHCQKQMFMIHSSLTNVIKLSNEDRLSRFHECGRKIHHFIKKRYKAWRVKEN